MRSQQKTVHLNMCVFSMAALISLIISMVPRDDLASRSTKWVLARPGESYVAYSYENLDKIGLKGLVAGTYDLFWMDVVIGETFKQDGITVHWGNAAFTKPESFGNEVVVFIQLRK